MSKRNDLFVVHLFNDFSGSPRVLADAIDACEGLDANIYLLTSKHAGFLDNNDARRYNVFYQRGNHPLLTLAFYLLSQFHLLWLLGFLLIRSKLAGRGSVVLANTMLPFAAGLVGKLFARRVVFYVHETKLRPALLKKFLRAVINFTADHVLFVSKYLQQQEAFHRPLQHVIYNGLSRDFESRVSVDLRAKFSGRQVLLVGSLKIYKGIEQFIELAKACPDYSFVAALNCEPDELLRFCEKQRDLPTNLSLLARPDHLVELYRGAFCVMNLSLPEQWVETFGLSLLEGMHFACPVVAPQVGGPTEVVNEQAGALIDARDIPALKAFIEALGNDESVWSNYAQHAAKTAALFTNQSFQQEFRQFLQTQKII